MVAASRCRAPLRRDQHGGGNGYSAECENVELTIEVGEATGHKPGFELVGVARNLGQGRCGFCLLEQRLQHRPPVRVVRVKRVGEWAVLGARPLQRHKFGDVVEAVLRCERDVGPITMPFTSTSDPSRANPNAVLPCTVSKINVGLSILKYRPTTGRREAGIRERTELRCDP
jgi:hypothetical protein